MGRLLPVGAATRELGSWLAPLLLIAIAGVAGGILAGGLPAGPAGPVTVGILAIAAALAGAGLSGRVGGRRSILSASPTIRGRIASALANSIAACRSAVLVMMLT